MRLVSCPICGVVVNLDEMVNISKCDCSEDSEFNRLKKELNHFYMSDGYDSYNNGFYCPCCKKWVNIGAE